MGFTILTDTSCNLPEELVDRYELSMVPLRYIVDGTPHASYTDGKQADFKAFYDRLRRDVNVTTALASAGDGAQTAREILQKGSDILYLGFSSGLSGTYAAVSQGVKLEAENFPERTVYCVDTLAASAGQGLLISYVAEMRDAGASIEECYRWALDNRLHISHQFTVDDLMFLRRGGRIGAVSAVFATALSIKPLMHVDDEGTLKVVGKVMGRRKSIAAMADKFFSAAPLPAGVSRKVFISHGDCEQDARTLADMIVARYDDAEHPMDYPLITYVDPVIGSHSGPGTLALFYFDTNTR